MITVIPRDKLGNLLFQYAAGRRLAIRNSTTLWLNLLNYMTKRDPFARTVCNQIRSFNIVATLRRPLWEKLAVASRLAVHPWSRKAGVYREKGFGFDSDVLSLGDGTCLIGFFQSEKYFKDIEPVIRNDLRLKQPLCDEDALRWTDRIRNSNSVGVHVRRGNYLRSALFNVCNMNYYENAIRHMLDRLRNPRFFVFSDDIAWCRANLAIRECDFVDIQAARKDPTIDLRLMSFCAHNVIANSSYSWWAAWLNENPQKIVAAPYRWFGVEDTNARAVQHTILESWERVRF